MGIQVETAAAMKRLGEKLANGLRPGDVLVLQGDLGAGKSELVRGIAAGLGIHGPIPSPTFTIMNAYEIGRIPLYHFDWYRLQQVDELYEMGLDEFIGGDGIAAIEWAERFPEALPPDYLEIAIRTLDKHKQTRDVTITPVGAFRLADGEEGSA